MDASFRFIRQEFAPLARIILIIASPLIILSSILFAAFINQRIDQALAGTIGALGASPLTVFSSSNGIWLYLVRFFSELMVILPVFCYMKLYKDRGRGNFSQLEVIQLVIKKIPTAFVVSLIITLLGYLLLFFSALSIFLLSPLAIWLTVSFSLSIPAVVFESKSVFESLGRSWNLAKVSWWNVLFIYIILTIVSFQVSTGFMIPPIILSVYSSQLTTGNIGQFFNSWVVQGLVLMFYLLGSMSSIIVQIGKGFLFASMVEVRELPELKSKFEKIKELNHA